MRSIHGEIEINAPAEQVWLLLTDFPTFPRWNPFIREASGDLRPGAKLTIRLRIGKRLVTFRPTVTKVEPGRELRWLARLPLPRLFDVERSFAIEPHGEGRVRFIQHEDCTGLLTPLILGFGDTAGEIRRGYDRFGLAVKALAEEGPER